MFLALPVSVFVIAALARAISEKRQRSDL